MQRRAELHEATRARAANPLVIQRWITMLAIQIEKNQIAPENIFNMDETGFELNDTRGLTLCRKGDIALLFPKHYVLFNLEFKIRKENCSHHQ